MLKFQCVLTSVIFFLFFAFYISCIVYLIVNGDSQITLNKYNCRTETCDSLIPDNLILKTNYHELHKGVSLCVKTCPKIWFNTTQEIFYYGSEHGLSLCHPSIPIKYYGSNPIKNGINLCLKIPFEPTTPLNGVCVPLSYYNAFKNRTQHKTTHSLQLHVLKFTNNSKLEYFFLDLLNSWRNFVIFPFCSYVLSMLSILIFKFGVVAFVYLINIWLIVTLAISFLISVWAIIMKNNSARNLVDIFGLSTENLNSISWELLFLSAIITGFLFILMTVNEFGNSKQKSILKETLFLIYDCCEDLPQNLFLNPTIFIFILSAIIYLQANAFFYSLTFAHSFFPFDQNKSTQLCQRFKFHPLTEFGIIPYLLIMIPWTIQYYFAFNQIVTANAVSQWYQSPVPDSTPCSCVSYRELLNVLTRLIFHHLPISSLIELLMKPFNIIFILLINFLQVNNFWSSWIINRHAQNSSLPKLARRLLKFHLFINVQSYSTYSLLAMHSEAFMNRSLFHVYMRTFKTLVKGSPMLRSEKNNDNMNIVKSRSSQNIIKNRSSLSCIIEEDSINVQSKFLDFYFVQSILGFQCLKIKLAIFFTIYPIVILTYLYLASLQTSHYIVLITMVLIYLYINGVIYNLETIINSFLVNFSQCQQDSQENVHFDSEVIAPFRHEHTLTQLNRIMNHLLLINVNVEKTRSNEGKLMTRNNFEGVRDRLLVRNASTELILSHPSQYQNGSLLMMSAGMQNPPINADTHARIHSAYV